MSNMTKNILLWLVIAMVLMSVFENFTSPQGNRGGEMDYSTFLGEVEKGNIAAVEISGDTITGETNDNRAFITYAPNDPKLIDDLYANGVRIRAKQEEGTSLLMSLLISSFPILLLIGVWIFFMKQMQGGGRGGALSFGKSKAKMLAEDKNHITFDDVAGVDEAKEDVGELVEFLRDPSRFHRLGGRIPRGVLMTGSPGTGKTLLAKAIAGEAKVPFFTISGSDFVEMFVGVGASRVRDMFDQAKKNAPCIIFIDEIDAVGRHRGAGFGGGNDEREQTLNQLLVEMDGFEENEGVIVIAATNRPDVLDPALLRPGRFDRQVHVPLPDIRGREAILKVHMRKVPVSDDVNPRDIARGTPGFSGAQIANLVNEAALLSARLKKKLVGVDEFWASRDKIMMGSERKSMVMSKEDLTNTAYHESGHTVVGWVLRDLVDPILKVTIIPRGRALGTTQFLPEADELSQEKEKLLAQIAVSMGGRIAEEIFMDQVTSGAAGDMQMATRTAESMVAEWGMSELLGPRIYNRESTDMYGRPTGGLSDETAEKVEQEITRIISEQYDRARGIIEDNRDKLEVMTRKLLEWETLESDQIEAIMEDRDPRSPDEDDKSAGQGSDANKDSRGEKLDTVLSESDIDLPDPNETV
ncbi:MAG: ATP-dependent metallopeptidase FtsH/Yme1/Tma family protein [Gammaproteobacteria bacterium]|nr:ATP-dependent metallopeptidase FtsH/Yme1/Tma family protein [Gammaproteobacteria bacterium]MYG67606.1 ATP-dependent metallopeptidase FtsH/Yme1/Tma family protein [Gammaproteobacteria bacterium]MYH89533.1 ATP-dependent metallopeptidase FtsH/Yme1/Tma family protein [Gammaproteobacteria bacterium]